MAMEGEIMFYRNLLKYLVLGTSIGFGVAGCGGSSGGSISVENPDFFVGRVSDGKMTGAFNPAGFSESQVRKLVAQTCVGEQLTGFNTQSREDGLFAFAATCNSWIDQARAVEYERIDGMGLVIEITGTDGAGGLTYSRIIAND